MLGLVRASLWGTQFDLAGEEWSHGQYHSVMSLAQEQAVAGLVAQGLMDSGVKLKQRDALEVYALLQSIRQRNAVMDRAVVTLCKEMQQHDIRFFVFKGQSIGAYYDDPSLRQSGDIDFYVYPEAWDKAIAFFRDEKGLLINDLHSSKDVCFSIDGIVYEMHRKITLFCYPSHSRYWEGVVMKEIMRESYMVFINGEQVPTLAPTYNAIFIFVHIFQHLIADGIGLRQFCDWTMLFAQQIKKERVKKQNTNDSFDIAILEQHLDGIGLRKAYSGLGAILTDYLGLPKEVFPFEIGECDHRRAPKLFDNMLKMGNFGHNVGYKHSNMMAHGIEHLWRMTKQSREFYHYASAEAWWHIPDLMKWWGVKIWRMMKH